MGQEDAFDHHQGLQEGGETLLGIRIVQNGMIKPESSLNNLLQNVILVVYLILPKMLRTSLIWVYDMEDTCHQPSVFSTLFDYSREETNP